MTEHTLSGYVREIKPLLQRGVFRPAQSRLWWLPVHLGIIAVAITALAQNWLSWLAAPFLSLVIGASFAGLTFLAHETLHGAIVRQPLLRYLVGWVGFAPFVVSPRLWVAWHNRVHHGNTQHPANDPDAYPTLEEYRQRRSLRLASQIAPGLGRWRGLMTPLIGFSVQSAHMLLAARHRNYLSEKEHAYALLETFLAIAGWSALGWAIGGPAFFFGFAIPLGVANVIVMSFILTNHSLSPLTRTNDPLANSLSVTTPRWLEWLTLGFGFHVEHHLFPAMSARHAPEIRGILRAQWPEKYQSMSLFRASAALHHTSRIYKDATTLVDPTSGREWSTLPLAKARGPHRSTTVAAAPPPVVASLASSDPPRSESAEPCGSAAPTKTRCVPPNSRRRQSRNPLAT